jgi:hypothetical protein
MINFSDVPSILSLRVSQTEQSYLWLGRSAEVVGIENEATNHDYTEVPIHLWNDRLTRPWRSLTGSDDIIDEELNMKLYKEADTIRKKFVLPWWKINVRRSFMVWFKTTYRPQVNPTPIKLASWGKYWIQFNGCFRWKYCWTAIQNRHYLRCWESQNGLPGSGKKRDSTVALDCITRAANTTWWEWTDGSRPFFWMWDPDYVATVRDGLRLWYKGSAPKNVFPQKDKPDLSKKEKIRLTLLKALAKRYFEYGEIASLTHFFAVAKGEEYIRMVYNGTSSGLNAHLWCPWFALETINTMLRALGPGTYMGDISIDNSF